ncbi:DNA-processing protein DprA [Vulcanococcus limneticus]|uniref:DNA-processing protein DprA n=1 Tax=Vulcanococcus limneticus TaxID=2170428 RepID=UPI00398BD743
MGDLLFAAFGAEAHRPEVPEPEANPRAAEALRLWWLLWSGCPGIGWQRLQALQRAYGSLERAWAAPRMELQARLALGSSASERIEAYRQRWGDTPIPSSIDGPTRRRLAQRRTLVPPDVGFPEAARNLERPPLRLHWQGNGSLWRPLRRREAIAVVGTRRPSPHGLSMARALGAALAEAGWPVVSGLAEGIDAAVHQGCLERGGRPVAVLGTHLGRVYPRHHSVLQAEVARAGMLVSEQEPGATVRPGHFAQRNRLQVALAQALVVVECPVNSGALHSAELAWSESLPLWVVPADAGKQSALGSNRLLASGATVLLDPADLIRSLGPGPLARRVPSARLAQPAKDRQASDGPDGNAAEVPEAGGLLEALGAGASLEQLCSRLGQGPSQVTRGLLGLELTGQIRAEPGLWWRPC